MKVKATRVHQNAHGDKFEKNVGDEYSLPQKDGERLIRRKLVEEIDGEADDQAKRVSGSRKDAGATAEGDGKERAAKVGKAGAGADAGESGDAGTA